MTSKPLPFVSITTPIYNHERYVEEALLSALNQDYDRLEVIAADDASTDRTQSIIRALHEKFPRRLVPIYGTTNLGVTKNANRGLAACRGDYVAFFSGDDVMLPGKISAQVSFMEQNTECSLSYHDVEMFAQERTLAHFSHYQAPRSGSTACLIKHGMFFCACSAMVRRAEASDVFDEKLPLVSDWLFFIDALERRAGTVSQVPGVWGRYRVHQKSLTHQIDLNVWLSEQLRTIEMVKAKYPHLRPFCEERRATMLAGFALTILKRERRVREAAASLRLATRSSPVGALRGLAAGARAALASLRSIAAFRRA